MPVMLLRYENNTYIISTGNLISNEKIGLGLNWIKLTVLIRMVSKELFKKALYRQTGTTESTGNMGLIDMARKSDKPLIITLKRSMSRILIILEVRIEDRII